uniref:Uncharacterized protein n=1 Tax=Arundo donax TaxID=35708 RepID=A0A0A9AE72_ARUDO
MNAHLASYEHTVITEFIYTNNLSVLLKGMFVAINNPPRAQIINQLLSISCKCSRRSREMAVDQLLSCWPLPF